MKKVILSEFLDLVFESSSKDYSEWFGYYNYDTLDSTHKRLLCNRADFDGIKPNSELKIELGYYDIVEKKWHHIDYTNSWNWQQGAMLQWVPGEGNNDTVIYNCTLDGHNKARICDLSTGEKKQIDWSIYGITSDGSKSICLEMERSHWCRAYHYESVSNLEWEGRVIDGDGIFMLDLNNNTRTRIISIEEIIHTNFKTYFDKCKHWVEHIMISPSSKRFCFLHRFSPIDNVYKYETRLFIADIDGHNLQLIPGWESFSWSHFGWKNDDEFVIYTQTPYRYSLNGKFLDFIRQRPIKFNKLFESIFYKTTGKLPYKVSKFLGGKRHIYQHYKMVNGCFQLVDEYGGKLLNIDGHPSFTLEGRYMITDSYPDNRRMQRLIVYDTVTKKSLLLGKFYAYYYRQPSSCDLHPKLSRDNEYLVVDSAFDEKHHMLVFKLNWQKVKDKISKE